MSKFSKIAMTAASAAIIGAFSTANAATYNIDFTSDGHVVDFSGVINTDNASVATGMTGWVNGTDAITGIVAVGTSGFSSWLWDNIFPNLTTSSESGILFTTAANFAINLYTDGTTVFASFKPGTGPQYNPGVTGTLSVSEVPLPASGVLLLGILGGVAALRRRKSA